MATRIGRLLRIAHAELVDIDERGSHAGARQPREDLPADGGLAYSRWPVQPEHARPRHWALYLFLATVRPPRGGKSSIFAAKNVQSRRPVCIKGASAVRYVWSFGFCLVLGLAFVIAAVSFGVLAIGQGAEVSAYHHARVCLAGAAANAECLQTVTGSVTGVTEISGKNADYALDVQTDSQNLHITFTSDSPMLGYAVNGDPASVTMWRGNPEIG